ncbi:hypothetical protein Hypma_006048 [Hypsizygus marmoreus]|uniref:Uncharacterized protein n=1 Tax=Hypsizygus marmoreus TaxID=39966 RepID=A0A369JYP4_HYPMA|nr:hypothetical protein Hypma_006048 [Hypsizygus marmoreus]
MIVPSGPAVRVLRFLPPLFHFDHRSPTHLPHNLPNTPRSPNAHPDARSQPKHRPSLHPPSRSSPITPHLRVPHPIHTRSPRTSSNTPRGANDTLKIVCVHLSSLPPQHDPWPMDTSRMHKTTNRRAQSNPDIFAQPHSTAIRHSTAWAPPAHRCFQLHWRSIFKILFSNLKVQLKLDSRVLDFDLTIDTADPLASTHSRDNGISGSGGGALVQVNSKVTLYRHDTSKITSLPIHGHIVAARRLSLPPDQKNQTGAYSIRTIHRPRRLDPAHTPKQHIPLMFTTIYSASSVTASLQCGDKSCGRLRGTKLRTGKFYISLPSYKDTSLANRQIVDEREKEGYYLLDTKNVLRRGYRVNPCIILLLTRYRDLHRDSHFPFSMVRFTLLKISTVRTTHVDIPRVFEPGRRLIFNE